MILFVSHLLFLIYVFVFVDIIMYLVVIGPTIWKKLNGEHGNFNFDCDRCAFFRYNFIFHVLFRNYNESSVEILILFLLDVYAIHLVLFCIQFSDIRRSILFGIFQRRSTAFMLLVRTDTN